MYTEKQGEFTPVENGHVVLGDHLIVNKQSQVQQGHCDMPAQHTGSNNTRL